MNIYMICGEGYTLLETASNYRRDAIAKYMRFFHENTTKWEKAKKDYNVKCKKFEECQNE